MIWEYLLIEAKDGNLKPTAINAELDRAGKSGWELVSVVFITVDKVRYYFKKARLAARADSKGKGDAEDK